MTETPPIRAFNEGGLGEATDLHLERQDRIRLQIGEEPTGDLQGSSWPRHLFIELIIGHAGALTEETNRLLDAARRRQRSS